ncbi:ATP-binding protein [Streptomyces sp. NPDC091217]|uniref:ATP-binding protein n=1 Tax=Streptomyces sp. NPDC091217 TaxID=3365975 RepID=UPI00382BF913
MTPTVSAALAFRPAGACSTESPGLESGSPAADAEVRSAALGSRPVRPQSWAKEWIMEACVPRLARLHARTRLGMMAWSGDQDAAVRVVTEVVRNAVQHVGTGTVELTMSVREDEVLIIDVADPGPGHDGLNEALAGGDGTGLWLARQLGGEVVWRPTESGSGKTIRVQMSPSGPGQTPPTAESAL